MGVGKVQEAGRGSNVQAFRNALSLLLPAVWLQEAAGPDTVAYFSSYGPMADGRIKPDVVAPGLYITSAGARGGITGR